MRRRLGFLLCTLVVLESRGEAVRPTLSNGVVTYVAEDGHRHQIQVGKKCADLWVAPDESILAFIAKGAGGDRQ